MMGAAAAEAGAVIVNSGRFYEIHEPEEEEEWFDSFDG